MARNERSFYFVELGSGVGASKNKVKIGFRSPKAIYESIQKELGVQDVKENSGFVVEGKAGELLPRLSLKLGSSLLNSGAGNQRDDDARKYVRVFCDPDKISNALSKLRGKTTRGLRIQDVKLPKRRVYL